MKEAISDQTRQISQRDCSPPLGFTRNQGFYLQKLAHCWLTRCLCQILLKFPKPSYKPILSAGVAWTFKAWVMREREREREWRGEKGEEGTLRREDNYSGERKGGERKGLLVS